MDTDYLKRVGIGILGAILTLGIVFYLGYHIWRSATKEVETEPVSKMTAVRTVEADGYIFRNETLVFADAVGGSIVPSAAEGENIRTGGELARVYAGSSPETLSRLAEIEEQAALLRECAVSGDSVSLKDSSSIDGDIYGSLSDIRAFAHGGDALGALSMRSPFLTAVNKREVLTGSKTSFEADIAALESEKTALTSQLGACLQSVSSPGAGYYYSTADGYEKIFVADALEDITYGEVCRLMEATPESCGSGCAGKIVTSAKWYAVCRLDRKYVNTFKAGDTCTVHFKLNEKSIDMTVESVLEGDGGAAFVLGTREMPRGFDYTRVQTVELTETEYEGLRVPERAVRVVNGETGVYILEGSTVRFRRISVLYRSEGVCIADADAGADSDGESDGETDGETDGEKKENETPWLRLHDSVIIKGKGLYDGRVIGS